MKGGEMTRDFYKEKRDCLQLIDEYNERKVQE